MTDHACFAILRATTLQIIQAAGFDGAHLQPTDVLTDVFCQYIQLLSSTVTACASLAGRSKGTSWDVLDALSDLAMDAESLEAWFDEECKVLVPIWSDKADPGDILQSIVSGGRSRQGELVVYEYRDKDDPIDMEEYDEEQAPATTREDRPTAVYGVHKSLDHIPLHMPPFPPDKEDEDVDEQVATATSSTHATHATCAPSSMIPPSIHAPAPTDSLSGLPTSGHHLVRNRRKQAENPFKYLVTFDESTLSSSSMALSLSHDTDTNHHDNNNRPPTLKVEQNHASVKHVMHHIRHQPSHPSINHGRPDIFRSVTEDEAAAGTNVFGFRSGILEELVRTTAHPIAVSLLSSPNLLVDMMASTSSSRAATPDVPPETPSSTSILMTLAGGTSSTSPHSSSSHNATLASPHHTNALSTPSSPLPTQPTHQTPISLASLSQHTSRKRKKHPKLTINMNSGQLNGSGSPSSSPLTTPASTPKIRFTVKKQHKNEAVRVKSEPSHTMPNLGSLSAQSPLPSTAAIPSTESTSNDAEVIRCICDNPTIDYGTFMIACDKCSVWFHGTCVGIAENDQVEEWYCGRCTQR